jgi:hypothetical protein
MWNFLSSGTFVPNFALFREVQVHSFRTKFNKSPVRILGVFYLELIHW